jgi:hypothetical protein
MVAGCDPRVAAAVPIYGVGQNTYTFPWQSPDDPVDEDVRLTRALIEPEGYAADVKCPLLFMNSSNDHHGRLDLGMRTLALATKSVMLREVYTPRYVHHIEPAEAQDLPMWMDSHLNGIQYVWPASPTITIEGGGPVPKIRVHVDSVADVRSVTIYYGLNNPWPASRFYRTVNTTATGKGEYSGDAPITGTDDKIFAFANVTYESGIRLSTRLVTVAAKDLPKVQPTLKRTPLIDTMEDDRAWFWWLAGTDPVNQQRLLQTWKGPQGQEGFTHGPPGAFSFATNILSDPQFQSDGTQSLLIDVWNADPPTSLEVTVATKFFEPGQMFYKFKPRREGVIDAWQPLKLRPSDFLDEQKKTELPSWKDVTFLWLSGTTGADQQTVFKNLRWEDPE